MGGPPGHDPLLELGWEREALRTGSLWLGVGRGLSTAPLAGPGRRRAPQWGSGRPRSRGPSGCRCYRWARKGLDPETGLRLRGTLQLPLALSCPASSSLSPLGWGCRKLRKPRKSLVKSEPISPFLLPSTGPLPPHPGKPSLKETDTGDTLEVPGGPGLPGSWGAVGLEGQGRRERESHFQEPRCQESGNILAREGENETGNITGR